jgi:hypothetical protein
MLRRYWTSACQTCALKARCTPARSAGYRGGSTRPLLRRYRTGSTATGQDGAAPPDRGATVRDHQGVDGRHAFPNETVAESGQRNGAARAGLQHEARDADSGCLRIDGRHAGLRRVLACPNRPVQMTMDVIRASQGSILENSHVRSWRKLTQHLQPITKSSALVRRHPDFEKAPVFR